MTCGSRGGCHSRAALYAQQRRDNEVGAREELGKQLPADAFRAEFITRGEFNLTTKTLLATLLFLDPDTTIKDRATFETSTLEYNQHRRTNEATIRDRIEAILPASLLTPDIAGRSDFNKTTKVMISACLCVKDILQRQGIAGMSSSTLSGFHEILDKLDNPIFPAQQAPIVRKKRAAPLHRQVVAVEQFRNTRQDPDICSQDSSDSNPVFATRPQAVMAPDTRSSSNLKTHIFSPKYNISPADTTSSDDTIVAADCPDDIDLLTNLRADELDQATNLDVKPPPLPRRAFQNQGHWEIRPKDVKSLPHNNCYVRALEQAANRLVAKAKELVIVHEGDDDACQRSLMEAQEWCVDTIGMVAGEIDRQRYRKKWMARRAEWEKRNDSDLSIDD